MAALPRIDALLADAGDLVARYGRADTVTALREAVGGARAAALDGDAVPAPEAIVVTAAAWLSQRRPGPPRAVVNAAGVIVHTNLGRAPLSAAAIDAMTGAAGACDLEIDLDSGQRGSRMTRLAPLLADAAGGQAGIAVNNAAAALVLVLAALARGRQVLVSRGELVEIGGSFRLPDIMAAAGVTLVEVGTTNKTRAEDYAAGDDPALILKVHPSNYRITGFTHAPTVAELAAVARQRGVPLVHDVGSGLLDDHDAPWLAGEPSLRGSLAAGADLAVCSGDKLLGGPQAGLIVGRADLVAACARQPLARALRLDKLRVAALVATLEAHLAGARATLPVWAALEADVDVLTARSADLATAVGGTVVAGSSVVGGGAAPGSTVPTPVVRIACAAPNDAARRLRTGDPPIVVRVDDDALLVDLRTVAPQLDGQILAALRRTLDAR